jgi:hypothetical protein
MNSGSIVELYGFGLSILAQPGRACDNIEVVIVLTHIDRR